MVNSIDKKIEFIAISAISKANNELNLHLDFTEQSLVNLERIISCEAKLFSLEDYSIDEVRNNSRLWGSYLGETIRRNLGGTWRANENSISLVFKDNQLSPVEFVEDRLLDRIKVNLLTYYADLFETIRGYPTSIFSSVIESRDKEQKQDKSISPKTTSLSDLRDEYVKNKPVPINNPSLISCKACNRDVSHVADLCPHCGIELPGVKIRCPRCNSINISSSKKGYGIGTAAAGLYLLGPVGLLGGLIGKDGIRLQCKDCGKKWEPTT